MQWCTEFNTELHDLTLAQPDEWRGNADVAGLGPLLDERVEGVIVGRTAVGIAGAVLLYRAEEDGTCAEDFSPADGGGKEVGIAERGRR